MVNTREWEKIAEEKYEKSKSKYACTQTGKCTYRQRYSILVVRALWKKLHGVVFIRASY